MTHRHTLKMLCECLPDTLGHIDGSMFTTRATNGDGQVGALAFLIEWDPVQQHIDDVIGNGLRLWMCLDKLLHLGCLAGMRA